MTFEEFENILIEVGAVDYIGAEVGSSDYEVKFWRCFGNSDLCQVKKLYERIIRMARLSNEVCYYKGKVDAFKELVEVKE